MAIASRGVLSGDFLRAWWERRQALRELSLLQRRDEASIMVDDANPLNRAVVSISLGDNAEALRCWREARERFPRFVRARPESLKVLFGLQRYDEAEELMEEGLKHDPRNPYFAEGMAEAAHRRRDLPEALRRWTKIRRKFPSRWMAYAHGCAALRELGQVAEAERLISRAITLFPDEIHCRIEWARIAEASGNWNLALQRWDYVGTELKHVSGVIGVARALKNLGRDDEARERLVSVRTRYSLDREFSRVLEEFLKKPVQ
ncbi:MAG TPA: tetratricopeptide repeat protein [Acetobacteraceae bacterium]|nr:tetratricopeptide repeat protein [Acetobacteraceae bacterium]